MKIIYTFFCFLILIQVSIAQDSSKPIKTITDADLQGGQTYNWSRDTTYLIEGIVYLESGGRLNIEAGTVIKGATVANGLLASSTLIITRGAQIFAEGTATQPIIFTSELDDLNSPIDIGPNDRGLWGGIVILGNAPVIRFENQTTLEGLPPNDLRNKYGPGEEFSVDPQDNSGVLRYVSIRHTGRAIDAGVELPSLLLAAVGSGTTIEFVEAFGGLDDGFSFWGGTVDAKYLISAVHLDDAFDYDQSWTGRGQFWFAVVNENGHAGEHDGAETEELQPEAVPSIYNATYLGDGFLRGESNSAINLRAKGAVIYVNSIFSGFSTGLLLRSTEEEESSYNRFINGDTRFLNNIWFDFTAGNDFTDFIQIQDRGGSINSTPIINLLEQNENEAKNPLLNNTTIGFALQELDPRPSPISPALENVLQPNNNWFEATNYRGAFGPNDNWALGWTALDLYGYLSSDDCNSITGKIGVNEGSNCDNSSINTGLSGWVIGFQSDSKLYLTSTNEEGLYAKCLPTGTYTVTLYNPQEELWTVCNNDLSIDLDGDVTDVDLSVEIIRECPLLNVDISTSFIRRCFENFYYVNYQNIGTETATNAYVDVSLDENFTYLEASIPGQFVNGNTYRFQLGDIPIGTDGRFKINVQEKCESELGETLCTEAVIFPKQSCNDEPILSIDVDGICELDSVTFFIKNKSDLNMSFPSNFIVIEDDVIFYEGQYQLNGQEQQRVSFASDGKTIRLETEEVPGEPSEGLASSTVEGCGTDESGSFSTGFVNQFPLDDDELYRSIDCRQNRGAFDPNDIQGFPIGYKDQHFIDQATSIEYLIRFQNTGTDTAFKVVILDTLPIQELNPLSIIPGSSSHPYSWVLDNEVLQFTFDNIMLPDSNINEPASHGFVRFYIEQQNELPIGSRINNKAAIFFDFNEPVITNTAFHTIGEKVLEIVTSTNNTAFKSAELDVYPNPGSSFAIFELKDIPFVGGQLTLFDVNGKLILDKRVYQSKFELNLQLMENGIYFYRFEFMNGGNITGKIIRQ